MIKTFNYLFVTCFGIGSFKFASGTITSLITTVFLYSLFHIINLPNITILIILLIVFIYSFYAVSEYIKTKNKISNIILLDRLTIWKRLYKKIVVTKEVIVPGANLKDPIPKHVTNK